MGSESRSSEFFLMTPWIEMTPNAGGIFWMKLGKKYKIYFLYDNKSSKKEPLFICVGHTWGFSCKCYP